MKKTSIQLINIILLMLLVQACSTKQNLKVVCVGDSITEGHGLSIQSQTSYPVMLDSVLGEGYTVLNSGRSATTLQRKGDFPYWISKEFSNAFAFEPDIIVIKLGTNDTKPQNWNASLYEQDYQALIDTIRTMSTHPQIYVCLPAPVFKTKWGINDSLVVNGVIPIIERLANKNQLTVIDLYNGLLDQVGNFPDSIHPNEEAAKKMAAIIADVIKK